MSSNNMIYWALNIIYSYYIATYIYSLVLSQNHKVSLTTNEFKCLRGAPILWKYKINRCRIHHFR